MRLPIPLAAVLLVLLLVVPALPASADPESAVRLADLRNRRVTLEDELSARRADYLASTRALQEAREALESARARWLASQERVAGARRDLRAIEIRFAERARQLYVGGEQASLALVLALSGSVDLETALEYLSRATTVDSTLLEELRLRRDEVERLDERVRQEIEDAESTHRRAELHHRSTLGTYRALEDELVVLEHRIANLEEAWADFRLALAREMAAGVAGPLRRETLAQAEWRASLPLGPTWGVPEALRSTGRTLSGVASWYGPGFHGRPTASGVVFDERDFTAAHRTLPLGSILLVAYRDRQVVVLVNDRGPYVDGREFDLSRAAAEYLGLGLGRVTAELLVPEDSGGSR